MARKLLLPKQPLLSVSGDPKPGNDGQLNAVLDSGIDFLSKNRGDITPIIKAAKLAKGSL